MNKNATPLLLIILAIGTYFTFTRGQIEEVKSIQKVNAAYKEAVYNSESLIKVRDSVFQTYNDIDPADQARLEKLIPNNVDNVRLIIDINALASRHGLSIKNVKTTTPKDPTPPASGEPTAVSSDLYNTATFSFDIESNYPNFIDFLRDLEASLRIIEISKISLKANDTGNYEYNVELKTFWLKQ
ncbi:MAG: type 4a pilus biogenesis protein PilO [Candidatus Taylorbacteria bacterium]|nr:type 4a pilus biogenesis protein PilO [Candidatus Taylorbacteria bacterium]